MSATQVSFLSGTLKIAGDLYIPESYKKSEKLPAIILVHPFGGVKEQTAGTYARELSKEGFVTLAIDRRHQGASEGTPRQLEDPYGVAEDIKSAVTFLSLQEQVDPARIGITGVCAGGGYVVYATSVDKRLKAVATVSGACLGRFIRTTPKPVLDAILEDAGRARIEYAKTGEVKYLPILPKKEEINEQTTNLMEEGSDYYLTPRGAHPNSINRTAVWSYDQLSGYDSFAFADNISPRPLLLIAGSKADTLQFSEMAYNIAKEPKELYLIEGSTHVDLYDVHLPKALVKLIKFFKENL